MFLQGVPRAFNHALQAEILKGIGSEVLSDLFNCVGGGDELSSGGCVYAIKTGMGNGW